MGGSVAQQKNLLQVYLLLHAASRCLYCIVCFASKFRQATMVVTKRIVTTIVTYTAVPARPRTGGSIFFAFRSLYSLEEDDEE